MIVEGEFQSQHPGILPTKNLVYEVGITSINYANKNI